MSTSHLFLSDNIYFTIDEFSDRKYWFVRTNSGEYYTEYFNEGFIAVGLNEFKDTEFITKAESDPSYKRALYEKIKAMLTDGTDKIIKPGLIINQLKRFMIEMSIGDIVLIPSENSQYISFGEITSDVEVIDESLIDDDACSYTKRRKVRWIKTIKKENLDPYLFKAIYSHHMITDVTEASHFINRSLSNLYVKNNKAYITFNVRTTNAIHAQDLKPLLYGFSDIAEQADFPADIIKDLKGMELKINVQSPGPIEYICSYSGLGIILFILFLVQCYRSTERAMKQGGEVDISIGLKGLSLKQKFNPPSNISYDELEKKIKEDPKALDILKEIANAINTLEVQTPTEKRD
ncbi:hypothetical protein [Veillonella sp. VA141]|uniref:hypothetical protein n=1 Tax=Veillonella sp. VA141 TaxID=741833 RepID=UPI000F8E2F8C|nr:hypothetical protein [Veillonella sp. VA141]